MSESSELLRAKLNAETGRLRWPELQRHYARGAVLKVTPDLDLVEVAVSIAEDDRASVEAWLHAGRLARASDADALDWATRLPEFWAVVAAPWVLIQEIAARG
jgi:hypothetical protein